MIFNKEEDYNINKTHLTKVSDNSERMIASQSVDSNIVCGICLRFFSIFVMEAY